jgi:hypothetical protein
MNAQCPTTGELLAKYPKTTQYNLKRKKKTPLKRPPCSFMLFCKDFRPKLQREFPKYTNAQITQLLGTMWHRAHPVEKEYYRLLAEQEKAKFRMLTSSSKSSEGPPKKRQKVSDFIEDPLNSTSSRGHLSSQKSVATKQWICRFHQQLCVINMTLSKLYYISRNNGLHLGV